jgi:hypothetical protein
MDVLSLCLASIMLKWYIYFSKIKKLCEGLIEVNGKRAGRGMSEILSTLAGTCPLIGQIVCVIKMSLLCQLPAWWKESRIGYS